MRKKTPSVRLASLWLLSIISERAQKLCLLPEYPQTQKVCYQNIQREKVRHFQAHISLLFRDSRAFFKVFQQRAKNCFLPPLNR